MYKNRETGFWEHDWRRGEIPRLHVSYGVGGKKEAARLHDAVGRLFRGKHLDLIAQVRAGTLTPTQLADHFDAELPVSALRAAVSREAVNTVNTWPALEEAITEYLAWVAANPNKADRTHGAADNQLARFRAYMTARGLNGLRLDQVTSQMVTDYQTQLYQDGAAVNTITNYVRRVGTLFHWYRKREARAASEAQRPARNLHVPLNPEEISAKHTRRERFLSEPEAERLLTAAPAPLLFPIMAGLFAGLRVDEMLHLRPAFDVDLALNLLTIQPHGQSKQDWTPKNGKRRVVPIATPLRDVLVHHLTHYASEEWVCPGFRFPDRRMHKNAFGNHFTRIVAAAELMPGRTTTEGVVFHTLRHTFASWLAMRGVDLWTISRLLGNSLAMVEETYSHLAPDARQRAVDRLTDAIQLPTLTDPAS